jgi:hypothetical protein
VVVEQQKEEKKKKQKGKEEEGERERKSYMNEKKNCKYIVAISGNSLCVKNRKR